MSAVGGQHRLAAWHHPATPQGAGIGDARSPGTDGQPV